MDIAGYDKYVKKVFPSGNNRKAAMQDTPRDIHNRTQADIFDRLAETFAQDLPRDVQGRLARIVAAASPRPREAILDVATGAGVLIPHMLPYRPSRIDACDLSSAMLSRAREKYPFVTFHQADVIDLPGAVQTVDVIYCNSAFGNLYDQYEAILAMSRLLNPGGRLVISHSEGRRFHERLRKDRPDMVLNPLPEPEDGPYLLKQAGLDFLSLTDEPLLYVLAGTKPS
jgi:demethylmenaquinone methyltransferase/2-methoxy-6-polyprenyl-1,4-benzoquinol methylase